MNTTPSQLVPSEQRQRTSTTYKLYISHFLSTWNMRVFEFSAVLFLANIYPGTLLPLSIYALVRALSAVLLSPFMGEYLDRTNRLVSIRVSIVGQRCAVVISCFIFWAMLEVAGASQSVTGALGLAALSVLACVEKLCSILNVVAVERDWVVVIGNDDEKYLQRMNAQMRRIDLFCKIIGPLAVATIDGFSPRIAVLATLGLNMVSMVVEYALIARVYHCVPDLQLKSSSGAACGSQAPIDGEGLISRVKRQLGDMGKGLKSYATLPAFLPSFSLSLLYLTVLSFSGQMTTYLLTIPTITAPIIGGIRAVATVFELGSTWLGPYLISRIGATRAGMWCLSFQILCLGVGVLTFFHSPTSGPLATPWIFIASIIFSRTGLYAFDLVAQLIIQGAVPASQRGSFSAIEASIQNFFELLSFLTTIVFPKPAQFVYPAYVSFAAVCCAGAVYAKYLRDRRGHLFHSPCDDWAKNHWSSGREDVNGYEMVPTVES